MTIKRRDWCVLMAGTTLTCVGWSQGLDYRHAAWSQLLSQHVVLLRNGQASEVRYAGFAAQRDDLHRYLSSLSAATRAEFDASTKAQQMAFLMNAYNAFTIELVLTRYPKLKSIKDLGNLLSSPWKLRWIKLLGDTVSLDDIEHGWLRKRGVYDDPRIHFAVNCASIGCPMLREEAYVPDRLEQQLDQQTRRFMSDRTRNRWNEPLGRLELSRIFDWYAEDFRLGHKGIDSLQRFVATHAPLLADKDAERTRLQYPQVAIHFLDYDWRLNQIGAAA
jgi:hypothetical protein